MRSNRVAVATVVASVFTLALAASLGAQELLPGLRIRSWVAPPGVWRIGTLVRYGMDSLVIQRCSDCTPEAQP